MDNVTLDRDRQTSEAQPINVSEPHQSSSGLGRIGLLVFVVAAGVAVAIYAARGRLPFLVALDLAPAARDAARQAPGILRQADGIFVPEGSPYRERIVAVPVVTRSLQSSRSVPAIVEADPARIFNILPPLGGRVAELRVRLGDRVVAGQPLVTIDSGDLAQAYSDADKARAQVALTRRALDRARGLSQVGGGAIKDLESAQNDAAQAEAEFARTQARLKAISGAASVAGTRSLTITAPASGTITALSTAPGAYINDATQSMMTVSNLESVWVTANVPEKDLRYVARGQEVGVTFAAYPGESFDGTVLFVSDVMEPDTRRTKVRVAFPNPDTRFKPNMFATVTLRLPARDVLTVPNSALLMNNDSTTVFVEQAPWRFVRRDVQLGPDRDGATAVTSGLAPGERIVVRGGVLLND